MSAVIGALIGSRGNSGLRSDPLSLLLAARDASGLPLDMQTIADELVTLLLAGHETTANALAWAWYLLAREPGIEARVAAEVAAAAGDDAIGVEHLPLLPLTARVFTETLRLYPPASAFGRRALDDCMLGGYAIRRGDGILLSPFVSGRDRAVFAEPERFRPDRWLDARPPPFAYFPFGGGARLCIGEAFARMEGTLVLAAVTQHCRLEALDAEPVGIAAHATLRPARPIVLRVRLRS
jgi:cytochrome P450